MNFNIKLHLEVLTECHHLLPFADPGRSRRSQRGHLPERVLRGPLAYAARSATGAAAVGRAELAADGADNHRKQRHRSGDLQDPGVAADDAVPHDPPRLVAGVRRGLRAACSAVHAGHRLNDRCKHLWPTVAAGLGPADGPRAARRRLRELW